MARQVRVGALVCGIDGVLFHAGLVEHIPQTHAGEIGATDSAIGPLIAARRRTEKEPAITRALDHTRQLNYFELLLEIVDRELERIFHQTIDGQLPTIRVRINWQAAIFVNEEMFVRGDRRIQKMVRRLGIDRPVVEKDEPFLALEQFGVRERGGDETRRHGAMKRNGGAKHGAHSGEARAAREPAPVRIGFAAEHSFVGGLGIRAKEDEQALRRGRLSSCHSILPWNDSNRRMGA